MLLGESHNLEPDTEIPALRLREKAANFNGPQSVLRAASATLFNCVLTKARIFQQSGNHCGFCRDEASISAEFDHQPQAQIQNSGSIG